MYSKLFRKILDSSVWLEPHHVRVVWITLLAAMDQDGYVELTCPGNVANRARVSEEEVNDALKCLEAPDPHNLGQPYEGRRIERIPGGGWMVLRAPEYNALATAESARVKTRERVQRFRAKRSGNVLVTPLDVDVDKDIKRAEKRKNAKVAREAAKSLEGQPTDPAFQHPAT